MDANGRVGHHHHDQDGEKHEEPLDRRVLSTCVDPQPQGTSRHGNDDEDQLDRMSLRPCRVKGSPRLVFLKAPRPTALTDVVVFAEP
jgi:hypothetical protein